VNNANPPLKTNFSRGIDLIVMQLQSGSAIGSNDFAITSLQLADATTPSGMNACTIANF
jgi:hypothetical protein